jgi:hypothetical protein
MKNKTIIGIGIAGLLSSIAGGYYYWVTLRVAALLAGFQGGNNLNVNTWMWFTILCAGIAMLFTSSISFFISRRHKSGLPVR